MPLSLIDEIQDSSILSSCIHSQLIILSVKVLELCVVFKLLMNLMRLNRVSVLTNVNCKPVAVNEPFDFMTWTHGKVLISLNLWSVTVEKRALIISINIDINKYNGDSFEYNIPLFLSYSLSHTHTHTRAYSLGLCLCFSLCLSVSPLSLQLSLIIHLTLDLLISMYNLTNSYYLNQKQNSPMSFNVSIYNTRLLDVPWTLIQTASIKEIT